MSEQGVETFLNQLTDQPALREQLSNVLKNAEDSAIGETVVAFANEAGFDISAEDLEWLNTALSEDAVSDEALDEVSGGFTGPFNYFSGATLRTGVTNEKDYLNPFKKEFWQ
ncbi:Nif11-like leader peptide family natural product precursor [Spiribacter sp. C176]|uniref:Nif11-like leader peptide family natural product n=1 Tax=Spiribacter salilacus TaxID=2664894 RepID=A0A6N7QQD0_9GAMM|nr:Nif11-like leader peptide family RiPP precursor [Spiribacter salilacus]MRH77589.1 Nif11-like leader peptide family natural product precursor [Spiribacter salilacus]